MDNLSELNPEPNPNLNPNPKSATIVSGYFQLSHSKHSHKKYEAWMENFFKIKTPKVIFTNISNQLKKQYQTKDTTNVKFIQIDFLDFLTYKYKNHWLEHHKIDHEKRIYNPYLYMIWNEKSNFVKKAIDLNPFMSTFYPMIFKGGKGKI